jgi:hypothetical protein
VKAARAAADRAVGIAKISANVADYAIPPAIVEARVTGGRGSDGEGCGIAQTGAGRLRARLRSGGAQAHRLAPGE